MSNSLRRYKILPACLLMSALLAQGAPADAGKLFSVSTQRKMSRIPFLKMFVPKAKYQLLKVDAQQMTLELPDQPIWAAFGKNDAEGDAAVRSVKLGRAVAKTGYQLAWGGGKGLPKDAANGAYLEGGSTVAFTPAGDEAKHVKSHEGDVFQTTHLVLTGTGGGSGTIAREAPMAQSANHGIGSFSNGGPGTFGELIAMLHNDDAVLAFMKNTGGVADAAPGWMSWLGAKPGFKVVSNADPKLLVKEATDLQKGIQLTSRKSRTLKLVSPGSPAKIFEKGENDGRVVAAFMTEDGRTSDKDTSAVYELMSEWAAVKSKIAPKGSVAVLPGGEQSMSLALTAQRKIPTVVISAKSGKNGNKLTSTQHDVNMRRVQLGYGDVEMGNFVASREVTQDADVVFFTSAHYQNLSALAYSLRDDRKPVIAVLANSSTHADKLMEMIGVIEPKAIEKKRVVVASSPAELMKLVTKAMEKRHEKMLEEKAKAGQKASLD